MGSVATSGRERNEGRGTRNYSMADEGHGSGAITRRGVLAVPETTWDEERRGTRNNKGQGTTWGEEQQGTRNDEQQGT
jgi:hypothetical protein